LPPGEGPESGHIVTRHLLVFGAALAYCAAPAPAAAQDLCAFIAKHGPAVFGTPLQAAAQCQRQGELLNTGAANNATGSDRLEVYIATVPMVETVLEGVRRDSREDRAISDEPSLGKGALLERTDKGRGAVFHFIDRDRYLRVAIRARDGLNDAYVERARQFAKVLKGAS
jgi:hypothetical protein